MYPSWTLLATWPTRKRRLTRQSLVGFWNQRNLWRRFQKARLDQTCQSGRWLSMVPLPITLPVQHLSSQWPHNAFGDLHYRRSMLDGWSNKHGRFDTKQSSAFYHRYVSFTSGKYAWISRYPLYRPTPSWTKRRVSSGTSAGRKAVVRSIVWRNIQDMEGMEQESERQWT